MAVSFYWLVSQPLSLSVSADVCQWVSQSIDQSLNPSVSQPLISSVNQTVGRLKFFLSRKLKMGVKRFICIFKHSHSHERRGPKTHPHVQKDTKFSCTDPLFFLFVVLESVYDIITVGVLEWTTPDSLEATGPKQLLI